MIADENSDPVEVFDVLAAMAASLVESETHFLVPAVPDKPVELKVGGKPPREIFYRKSVTFMTAVPSAVSQKKCTCRFICNGVDATIKCFSCATFDPFGTGYYCDDCFKSRHPWHRVPHVFADIEKDENIDYTLRVAHRRAEALRYEKEGKELLARVRHQKQRLTNLTKTDAKTETKLCNAGRKTLQLVSQMRGIRTDLKSAIKATGPDGGGGGGGGVVETAQLEKAAGVIKRVMLGYRVRKVISLLYVDRTVRVWNMQYGRDFYFDKVTGQSSWTASKFILKHHLHFLPYHEEKPEPQIWLLNRSKVRRRPNRVKDRKVAASIIQRFGRCVLARKRVVAMLKEDYRRVWDPDTSTYYYANIVTGESTWTKPKLFLLAEPAVLETQTKAKKKVNPLLNRV